MSFFSFLLPSTATSDLEIKEIFPLQLRLDEFVKADITATYAKILTDTIDRCHGIPTNVDPLLWDNCVHDETPYGLVTLIANAMAQQSELFLVYKKALGTLRIADDAEQAKIKADYDKSGKSSAGTYISFKDYRRTHMLKIYSGFEFCTLSAMNKSLNLAKAIQLKTKDLRGSVALTDSAVAIGQAKAIATALSNGNDVLIDAGDTIETAQVDTAPAEKAISFMDAKKAWILGMPASYNTGEQTSGIGSTGEADARAVERGLKQYFVSIIRPAMKSIFGVDVSFKTQDFRQISSACEVLKSLDLVDSELMSVEAKRELVARMFDLDAESERKILEEQDDAQATQPEPQLDLVNRQ